LDKGALNKVEPVSGQFLSNIFLVPKRDGKSRPVINLKYLNAHIQYDHFKIEDTHFCAICFSLTTGWGRST
jgi:hypothetical protein